MDNILDTGDETHRLLVAFEMVLDEIRTKVADDHRIGFGCFLLGWTKGNVECETSTSPVCVLCRALHEGTWEVNREDSK